MEGDIIVTKPYKAKRNQIVAFKNNAPFINCIPKINGVKIDNADYLRVVMLMYNLLECSKTTEKQQVVFGIITEMNQVIISLLILNLVNTGQVLKDILVMMETKLAKIKMKLLFY